MICSLHDLQPFLASRTTDGLALLPLRHCSGNVLISVIWDSDVGPEYGSKEKSTSANTVGQTDFTGASDQNLILCPLLHVAYQVEVVINLECLTDIHTRRDDILEDNALVLADPGPQLLTQRWHVEHTRRIQFLERMLPGQEHSLGIRPVKRHVKTLPYAVLVVDDELKTQGCANVSGLLHLDQKIPEIPICVLCSIDNEAAAEGLGMHILHTVPHILRGDGAADDSIRCTSIVEALPVLLSKRCLDEVT
jgi:hypothetical protein